MLANKIFRRCRCPVSETEFYIKNIKFFSGSRHAAGGKTTPTPTKTKESFPTPNWYKTPTSNASV